MKTKSKKPEATTRTKKRVRKPARIKRIKRILIPVDFSPFSEDALRYACPIANAFSAQLELVYVDETNYSEIATFGPIDTQLLRQQYQADAEAQIKELIDALTAQGHKCRGKVVRGRAHHAITEQAKTRKADLIIMATHGHSGLKHLLMGSTAENVVRHAHCPVLTFRGKETK